MPESSDDIRQARSGDRDAIERLLERCAPRLERHAEARLGEGLRPRVRISDLVQSTYADVLRSVDGFTGTTEREFFAWVAQALENNIRDKVKGFGRLKRRGEQLTPYDEPPPSERTNPLSEIANKEEVELVHRAMSKLAPDHRQVLQLRFLDGHGHPEIAAALGRTETATRALLVRARLALMAEVKRLRSP